jgi:hypothetical protein
MTDSVLLGVPTGWHLSADWQANFMARIGEPRTFELSLHWARSNTKACAYSELFDKAYGDNVHLLLWETNIIPEITLEQFVRRAMQFNCVMTPGRFTDGAIGADPVFHDGTDVQLPYGTELGMENADPKEEFLPFECRWGATHMVWFSREVVKALVEKGRRFMWAKKDARLDHDMPIYCYDGDTFPKHLDPKVAGPDAGNPHRRLAIEQSLYSNIRSLGFGVWADPRLYTSNLRLGGRYPSLRLKDRAQVEKVTQ